MKIEDVARVTHEVNRAYCAAIGDMSQVPWEEAPEWQRKSAVAGVISVLDGSAKSPADQHAGWMAQKVADGWVYGPVKDPAAKTHPCMVPYDQLPPEQRTKDHLFRSVVMSLLQHVRIDPPTPAWSCSSTDL